MLSKTTDFNAYLCANQSPTMKKIIVALDSFKGCLDSWQAGHAVGAAARFVFPKADIKVFQVADGGEGSAQCIIPTNTGRTITVDAHDPIGRHIKASYRLDSQNHEAAIDVAAASGLTLLKDSERKPMAASSFGTGMLVRDAIDRGCNHIILCVGGTATVDGGAGLLSALGAQIYKGSSLLQGTPHDLLLADRIDIEPLQQLYTDIKFTVITDVTNPMVGSNGAAAVFGPQKGANPETIPILESGLTNLAYLLQQAGCPDIANLHSGGAGGGIAAAMAAVFNASLKPGAAYILDRLNFDNQLDGADIVITGEGRIDSQTLMGKLPYHVLKRASEKQIPVIAFAGAVQNRPELYRAGFLAAVCIQTAAASIERATQRAYAYKNLGSTTIDTLRLLTHSKNRITR